MESQKTLKQLRKEKFNTLDEFASQVGVSVPTACRWERGILYPTIPQILKIAKVLDCEPTDIFNIVAK